MRPGFISFTFFMTAFTGVTHLGAKELFRQWGDSNFADEHQNCPENHCHKPIFFLLICFTPSDHDTEAECAHDNHADVYGGVLDKLDTDPFEEKDVLAKPWVAAELVKELVIAEGEQVGGHLPDHLLPGRGDAPEGKHEDGGRGEDRQLQPALQLEQPAVRGNE